jgi:DNA-binding CsgD family transcriptional regulator
MSESDGRSIRDRNLYRHLYRNPTWNLRDIAALADYSLTEAEDSCLRLSRMGLLAPSPNVPCGYATVDPDAALARLLTHEERQLTVHLQQMSGIREAISSLVQDFPDLRNDRREPVEIETLTTTSMVNAFLEDAGSTVRTRMRAMHPGGPPPESLVYDMLLRDHELAARGIKVDGLYQRRTAESPYMATYLADAARPGREIRTSDSLPLRMILFDDNLAVLPTDPQDSGRGAVAIHGKTLVKSLHAVYNAFWYSSAPLGWEVERSDLGTPALDGQELLVVRMLAAGVKDDAIARRLGVSSRTLSRLISVLLEKLGARTRFQAALRVGELGLLSESLGSHRAVVHVYPTWPVGREDAGR